MWWGLGWWEGRWWFNFDECPDEEKRNDGYCLGGRNNPGPDGATAEFATTGFGTRDDDDDASLFTGSCKKIWSLLMLL